MLPDLATIPHNGGALRLLSVAPSINSFSSTFPSIAKLRTYGSSSYSHSSSGPIIFFPPPSRTTTPSECRWQNRTACSYAAAQLYSSSSTTTRSLAPSSTAAASGAHPSYSFMAASPRCRSCNAFSEIQESP